MQGLEEREFFIDNLLVRIHSIIVMIRWTGIAPWEFEFPFPGSLVSTFLKGLVTWNSRWMRWSSARKFVDFVGPINGITCARDTRLKCDIV